MACAHGDGHASPILGICHLAAERVRAKLHAYRLALRRRLALWLYGDYHPYPPPPPQVNLSPSLAHARAMSFAPRRLSWHSAPEGNLRAWQTEARRKLADIAGYPVERPTPFARNRTDHQLPDGFNRRRVYLNLWNQSDAPIDVIWTGEAHSLPIMICLQGTNSGSHLSWGATSLPPDPEKIALGADYALQAARRGYLALCLEQSCFGEREERHLRPRSASPTIDAANHAFLLGRSLLGERAADVSSVVDWLLAGGPARDLDLNLDTARIYVMGSSSGGTVALFASAFDERIGAVMASGCVGFVRDTIGSRRDDSAQNVIPGFLQWFETDDILALVAPRPLLVVSGVRDHIFPFRGVSAVTEAARDVYRALGAPEALVALSADGPHRFYPDVAWPAFLSLVDGLPLSHPT